MKVIGWLSGVPLPKDAKSFDEQLHLVGRTFRDDPSNRSKANNAQDWQNKVDDLMAEMQGTSHTDLARYGDVRVSHSPALLDFFHAQFLRSSFNQQHLVARKIIHQLV